MGLDSGDALGERDPSEDAPCFTWWGTYFLLLAPKYARGWGDVRPEDWPEIRKCGALVNELNRMPDKAEAQRIGRAHRWFDEGNL